VLPNFVILGGIRCGTSWLNANLSLHPEIFLPSKKETHFFDRHTSVDGDGFKAYKALYANWKGEAAVGDSTPNYLSNLYSEHNIPAMIKNVLPEVRFIISIRNPASRVVSQYWHARSKWPEYKNMTFTELVESKPAFLQEGFYLKHIRQYLEYFPRENFHIVLFDEIRSDPQNTLQNVYKFLGVDKNFSSPLAATRINSAYSKKHEGKSWLLWYLHRGFFKLGFYKLSTVFEKWNYDTKPAIAPEVKRWLVEQVYADRNRELQEWLGRDLSNWNTLEESVSEENG
jgi:hypothetical protein